MPESAAQCFMGSRTKNGETDGKFFHLKDTGKIQKAVIGKSYSSALEDFLFDLFQVQFPASKQMGEECETAARRRRAAAQYEITIRFAERAD